MRTLCTVYGFPIQRRQPWAALCERFTIFVTIFQTEVAAWVVANSALREIGWQVNLLKWEGNEGMKLYKKDSNLYLKVVFMYILNTLLKFLIFPLLNY